MFVGAIFDWPLNQQLQPDLGQWIWLATLIIGGAPIIWDTFRGILKKHFASDIVAMMAIIAAILLNDALPCVVIVIMQSGGKALEDYAFRRASSLLDAKCLVMGQVSFLLVLFDHQSLLLSSVTVDFASVAILFTSYNDHII